jgi:hypothetical protein
MAVFEPAHHSTRATPNAPAFTVSCGHERRTQAVVAGAVAEVLATSPLMPNGVGYIRQLGDAGPRYPSVDSACERTDESNLPREQTMCTQSSGNTDARDPLHTII